jgi:Na+/phosphate symporter
MDQLLEAKSIPALLVVMTIFMALHLIKGLAEFMWKLKRDGDSASETSIKNLTEAMSKNTTTMEHLDNRLKGIETLVTSLPKMKADLRRLFSAVKTVAGENWPEIRKEIMYDETC